MQISAHYSLYSPKIPLKTKASPHFGTEQPKVYAMEKFVVPPASISDPLFQRLLGHMDTVSTHVREANHKPQVFNGLFTRPGGWVFLNALLDKAQSKFQLTENKRINDEIRRKYGSGHYGFENIYFPLGVCDPDGSGHGLLHCIAKHVEPIAVCHTGSSHFAGSWGKFSSEQIAYLIARTLREGFVQDPKRSLKTIEQGYDRYKKGGPKTKYYFEEVRLARAFPEFEMVGAERLREKGPYNRFFNGVVVHLAVQPDTREAHFMSAHPDYVTLHSSQEPPQKV